MEKKVRGAVLRAYRMSVGEVFDPAAAGEIVARIPRDIEAQLQKLQTNEFYPISMWNAVAQAISAQIPDPQKLHDTMVRCGRQIGDDAVNSFLRLLIKFLKPAMFARKFPDFYRKDFSFGTLSVDTSRLPENFLAIEIADVEGHDYIGATSLGWIGFTLEMIGCKNLSMNETRMRPPAPQNTGPYRLEFAWG